ncbi:MAG: hypothetical protein ACPGR2_14840 [Psychrobium sp.]
MKSFAIALMAIGIISGAGLLFVLMDSSTHAKLPFDSIRWFLIIPISALVSGIVLSFNLDASLSD